MSYSQFKTLSSVQDAFGLETEEGARFLPNLDPIYPSETLKNFLSDGLPLATGREKARSEFIISPILLLRGWLQP